MVVVTLFYGTANLATACVHLWWNLLPKGTINVIVLCLANSRVPVLQRLLRLHCFVLLYFAAALAFGLVSAREAQTPLMRDTRTLDFDELSTDEGWADVPDFYKGLTFSGFYVFKPSDPALHGLISENDLNCAASNPNALYGTRYNSIFNRTSGHIQEPQTLPTISLNSKNTTSAPLPDSFTLRNVKIKPLNMPIEYTKVNFRGRTINQEELNWSIDFPAGFHDWLQVDIETFSKKKWNGLEAVEIWADFHNGDEVMDWEFCLDDLEVSFP